MTAESVSILDKGTYLLAVFSGEFSVEAAYQCVDRMAAACEKHRLSDVLLDCRSMTGDISVFDRYQVAEYGAAKRRQIRRLALLGREDVVLPDNFVENVSVNRGFDVKTFTDLDVAQSWISQSAPGKPGAGDGS